jgi:DNA-binding transcriptional ArsR family regulator
MAELPIKLWAAKFADGRPIHGTSLAVLALLWRWLPRHAKWTPGRYFVYYTPQRIAERRELDLRTIQRQLRDLYESGLVEQTESRDGFWLVLPPELAEPDPTQRRGNEERRSGQERRTTPTNNFGDVDDRSIVGEATDRSEICDRSIAGSAIDRSRDLRSIDRGSKEELDVKLEFNSARSSPHFVEAEEIIRGAPTPEGSVPLTVVLRHAATCLARLLAEGEDPALVRRVLTRAPDLVRLGRQEPRWHCAEMFLPRPWSRWVTALVALEQAEAQEAAAAAARTAAAAAERERVAADAERRQQGLVAALLSELAARAAGTQLATPWDLHAARLDPADRARVLAPAAALAAALRAQAGAAEAGHGFTLADLRAVLAGVQVDEQTAIAAAAAESDRALASLRQARLAAERDGRPHESALVQLGARPLSQPDLQDTP